MVAHAGSLAARTSTGLMSGGEARGSAMANVEASILIADQAVVSGSAWASGRAEARNPASSSSFPGLACIVTRSPTVTMCSLLNLDRRGWPYRRRVARARYGCHGPSVDAVQRPWLAGPADSRKGPGGATRGSGEIGGLVRRAP